MININDIFYGNSVFTGKGINYGQDIMLKGKTEPVGWLQTRYEGILKPPIETYQFGTNIEPTENFYYVESEDIGWFYVYFNSLEEFVAGYNILVKE